MGGASRADRTEVLAFSTLRPRERKERNSTEHMHCLSEGIGEKTSRCSGEPPSHKVVIAYCRNSVGPSQVQKERKNPGENED